MVWCWGCSVCDELSMTGMQPDMAPDTRPTYPTPPVRSPLYWQSPPRKGCPVAKRKTASRHVAMRSPRPNHHAPSLPTLTCWPPPSPPNGVKQNSKLIRDHKIPLAALGYLPAPTPPLARTRRPSVAA